MKHYSCILLAVLFALMPLTSCFHSSDASEVARDDAEKQAQKTLTSSRQGNPEDKRSPGSCKGLEIPYYATDEDLYVYSGFVSSYNHTTLCPDWVAYRLTDEDVNAQFKHNYSFSRDPQVKGRQASREDYSGSGYDKGHMVPRADMKWSKEAYRETFFFTNVCPQVHKMNCGCWNELEQMCRRVARHYGTLYVVTGPIFDSSHSKTIGRARVHVPDHFYKALLVPDGDGYHAIAFVMSNTEERQAVRTSAITVDSLEKMLNRDMFPSLEDKWQREVEAHYDWKDWKL